MIPRVAITTIGEAATRTAAATRAHGLEPILLPCIRITPAPDETVARVQASGRQHDWMIITSARVIETVWPRGGMPDTPVAAVGSATAGAVTRAGGTVAVTGSDDAAGLVARLADRLQGATVLFPSASGADRSTVAALESCGATVEHVPVYRTEPIGPGPDPVEAALFASPSAVAGWCATRDLSSITVAAIGPTTAAAIRESGHEPDVVADRPGLEHLVQALADHLNERTSA